MKKKLFDIGNAVEETGQHVASLFGKARDNIVKAVDQNNDGTFDMKDVSAVAESIGTAAKNAANSMKNSMEERNREMELKALQPVFAEDIASEAFSMSKLIRVADMDKRHAESQVCAGSIGFVSDQKDMRVVTIYRDKIDSFGLSFYPDSDCELYYVDPICKTRYIALDGYFDYLKVARVDELQRIAQDLGAKHFRVTFKEHQTTSSANTTKGKAVTKIPGESASVDAAHELALSAVSTVEIAAEMDCVGHAPVQPELYYLQKESNIQNLIHLRMNTTSPIMHQKYTLKLSNSSGIKEKDAVKIDAALKAMKISANTTVTSEARKESGRFFEYEIDF